MSKKSRLFLILSIVVFIFVFCVALMVGRYPIKISDFFNCLFTSDGSYETHKSIILNLRLPRTIMAACVGVGLSLSGLLFQEIFQNKLTSPDLLGVSTGASVGAAIAIILGLSSIYISVFAFITGVVTVIITLLISKLFRNGSSMILILSGIIVGGFMSSILSFVKYFADPTTTLSSITYWLMGSFENSKIENIYVMLPAIFICCIILLLLSWRINIIALGKEEAQTKGLNFQFYRILIISFATLLTALSVAFCGTISWVGLVIPHIVRLIVGRDTRKTIPLCISFGAIFMTIVDVISRTFTDSEIPLSAVTGLLGTMIFITILFQKRKEISNDIN